MANVLLTMLHKLGCRDIDHVGDSNGMIAI